MVIHRNRVLLIRRGSEPLKGQWSIPGGILELGEELAAGARREVREETGLEVDPLEVLGVFDRIIVEGQSPRVSRPRADGNRAGKKERRVHYHYVIIDYACRWKAGVLHPGSDVRDARWVRRKDLPHYELTEIATSVILQAFRFFERRRKDRR